jgi:ribA/ribD-fused uncharacterized protein
MIEKFTGSHDFLSNFYPCEIIFEGAPYPTVEHAFQAAKTFDKPSRLKIAALTTPGKAKAAGKKVQLREGWDTIRVDIMRKIVKFKFKHHADLAQKLLDTGEQELIEGNSWNDTFWGVCRGKGQNWLGKILMEVRTELQSTLTLN